MNYIPTTYPVPGLSMGYFRAIWLLRDTTAAKPVKAAEFARMMWPGAPMHHKTSNSGNRNASVKGKAAWLCGGSYLGRLKKAGYVELALPIPTFNFEGGYYLTKLGKEMLSKHAAAFQFYFPQNPLKAVK